ncbi:MAG: hypothetical protein H8E44_03415 [Planctomycetes bacterium]|nr:hypothetical protein [Planctomycetota bacterium]
MNEAEKTGGVEIFTDSLLRVTVVVEAGGQWYLVPKSANGWKRRQRLHLSPLTELQRLQPARGISPAWLGIQAKSSPRIAPESTQAGNHDSDIEQRPDASERILGVLPVCGERWRDAEIGK